MTSNLEDVLKRHPRFRVYSISVDGEPEGKRLEDLKPGDDVLVTSVTTDAINRRRRFAEEVSVEAVRDMVESLETEPRNDWFYPSGWIWDSDSGEGNINWNPIVVAVRKALLDSEIQVEPHIWWSHSITADEIAALRVAKERN